MPDRPELDTGYPSRNRITEADLVQGYSGLRPPRLPPETVRRRLIDALADLDAARPDSRDDVAAADVATAEVAER